MKTIIKIMLAALLLLNTGIAQAADNDKKKVAEYIYSAEDYERAGDIENALIYYAKAIEADKKDTFALQKRALLHLKLGDTKAVIGDYTTAIKKKAAPELYINRGTVHYRAGDFESALSDYDAAIKMDTDNVNAYFNRGVLYHRTKQYSSAIADFTRLIALQPDKSRNYIIRAGLYFESADYQRALRDCNKAIDIDPDAAAYYHNRAEVYRRLGQMKDAEADDVKAEYLLRKEREGK